MHVIKAAHLWTIAYLCGDSVLWCIMSSVPERDDVYSTWE